MGCIHIQCPPHLPVRILPGLQHGQQQHADEAQLCLSGTRGLNGEGRTVLADQVRSGAFPLADTGSASSPRISTCVD